MTRRTLVKAELDEFLFSPGEMLRDELVARHITPTELARRLGCPNRMMIELIRGNRELTPEIARDLECVLDIPAYMWLRREADYRATLKQLKPSPSTAADIQ